ncbi:DUF4339 domain-containing protein [Paenibacillus thiaminolyticus]|uniref:DUF4339 domain-containing protein n=1 Tax=Paenibacillus thiaminolyticus TaxID=49283 RepID=A0AAP9IZD4_PANTH|nr:DUF4339 domain-containing protein [Paenibacillus thiaminolyticus]MCY9536947.1 DUF4339 domain-containing protein [Paenibacillus thiaminolyticus]MCY9603697.1 DUF4339 domain-containing protein [Paenibacillus thiaminolyticus]MCY9606691.1 DUF4339 domain-containing protein [Paenibacillus thiaminolyticus]MCY9612769.1 DUF4339 domain-containing protein [Paenibacillus thiaminolyticus]MCY9619741.1 DUF4339 domain-containing protein [Paenibacillus thiaminolyticus]
MEHSTAFIQALREACSPYNGDKCYPEQIPDHILTRVRQKFAVPVDERLIAFYDFTIFGYGKDGIAIGAGGLYCKEVWTKTFIPWIKFAKLKTIEIQKKNLVLDSILQLGLSSSPMPGEQLAALVTRLRDTALEFASQEASELEKERSDAQDKETLHEALLRVCQTYHRNKVYLHPIPDDLLAPVRVRCNIPRDETVLAFFDFTIFSKGKGGIAFTEEGIYWRVITINFLSWRQFTPPARGPSDDTTLHLSGNEINLLGNPLKHAEWIDLFTDIGELAQLAAVRQDAETLHSPGSEDRPEEAISLRQAILRVLQPYGGDAIYKKALPEKINERVMRNYPLPADWSVWAYFDFSLISKGKNGVVFTDQGLYWKGLAEGCVFIPWHRLRQVELAFVPKKENLVLDGEETYSVSGSPIGGAEWLDMLNKIKALPQLAGLDAPIAAVYPDDTYPLLDVEFIAAVCRAHSFFDKLNDYDMDEEKDQLIREHFRIPGTEPLLAFCKTEPGTPWKYGLTITGRAISICNDTLYCKRARAALPLAGLPELQFTVRNKSLYVGEEEMFRRGDAASLHAMLSDLQVYAASLTAADNPVRYPYDASYAPRWNLPVRNTEEERWIVAEGGMLRGVHSESELKWAADTGQLDPVRTRCWKKGLPAWISAEAAGFV